MKQGYEYKKLGDITYQISDGSHNPPKGIEHSEYPMLSSKNIFFDRYDYESPRFLSEEDFNIENKRTNISEGDVLLTIVGTVGRTCCIEKNFKPFTLQRSVAVLKPKKDIIDSRYLMYSLHSLSDLWENEAKGVAQKGVYLKQVSNIKISIPSIKEQKEIVSELDLLGSVIKKQNKILTELEKLEESVFYNMFGDEIIEKERWEVKTLGEVGTFQRGGGFLKKDYVSEGIPCLHYGQIHMIFGVSTSTHLNCISEETARKTKYASKGDVIFAITSEDVEGSCKSTAWMGNYKIAVGGHTAIYKHSLNPIYVSYYTKSKRFNQAKAKYAHGFKVVEMKPSDLALIPIPIPPLSLQQVFSAKIEAIESMKAKVSQSLKETEKLFNSRMDFYFN